MKKILAFISICLYTTFAFAQSGSVYNATNYAYTTQITQANATTGSSFIVANPTAFSQAIPFLPYNTNASITINRNAATAETVTPSTVVNCYPNSLTCTLSGTFTYKHVAGETIQSGTFGLQEAINVAVAAGSGTIVIDASWGGPSGTSLITAAKGSDNVMIQDNRNPSGAVFYQWNGTAYFASGGGSILLTGQVPVENFGAVGDWNGTTGTDNTTAIQNCLNSLATTGGQCLLQAKKYKITGPLTISWSSVGIAGTSYGVYSTSISNQLAANVPVSEIITTSASADVIDAGGATINAPISFNKFNDFSIARSVTATGTAAGLSISHAGGWIIDRVWSSDSVRNFYFLNAGSFGTGYVSNSGALWGFQGVTPGIQSFGFYVDGSQSMESLRIRDSFAEEYTLGADSIVGLFVTGAQINDLMVRGFETSNLPYGEYIQDLGGGSSTDIHLSECINNAFTNAAITVNGSSQADGSQVEIKGGWNGTVSPFSPGIMIVNSSGVTISGVQFFGDMMYGIEASNSSQIAIVGNNFLEEGTDQILLSTVSNAAVTGNVMSATSNGAVTTFIAGATLTRSSISGNTLSGYGTNGITLDSTSDNNSIIGVYAINPANITTPITNSGTGNNVVN